MSTTPGTVSKILWHFTGGPLWDDTQDKQGTDLKPSSDAYNALCGILASKVLRTGRFHELVKIVVAKKRIFNGVTKKYELIDNVTETIKSSPVCCVADIPIQHLDYHSRRYGKIAIGFHRTSILNAKFNPVMYSLENSVISNYLHDGHQAIEKTEPWSARFELESLESVISDVFYDNSISESVDISSVEYELDCIENGYDQIKSNYSNILAYVKTFNEAEFDSIYCEREWRSTAEFSFAEEDIAMIVLPKDQDGRNYYEEFISSTTLPRNVSILCWEDLIEH